MYITLSGLRKARQMIYQYYKMNVEHHLVLKNKEVLRKGWGHIERRKNTEFNQRSSHWPNLGQFEH